MHAASSHFVLITAISHLIIACPRNLNLANNEITSFAGAKFLGSIRELGLLNVNKAGVTSLAGVTFNLELGDPDWVCSTIPCELPGSGSLIAGYVGPPARVHLWWLRKPLACVLSTCS